MKYTVNNSIVAIFPSENNMFSCMFSSMFCINIYDFIVTVKFPARSLVNRAMRSSRVYVKRNGVLFRSVARAFLNEITPIPLVFFNVIVRKKIDDIFFMVNTLIDHRNDNLVPRAISAISVGAKKTLGEEQVT